MEDFQILGQDLMHWKDFYTLLIRFFIDFLVAFVLIRGIYFPLNKNKEYLLTFFVFNVVIFFVCILLGSVKLKIGFAFGLFAVFSILRYRTEQMPIKEMTFLFLSITVAVVNALVNDSISFSEMVFTNVAIILTTLVIERYWLKDSFSSKRITYEKIDLIKPDRKPDLIADLEERTGVKIIELEINSINFLRDTADITIYYADSKKKKDVAAIAS